jgi:hypothetical protein
MQKIDPNITYTILYILITAFVLSVRSKKLAIEKNMCLPIILTSTLNILDIITTFLGSGIELTYEGNYWVVNHNLNWIGLILIMIAWQLIHIIFVDYYLNTFKVFYSEENNLSHLIKEYFLSNSISLRLGKANSSNRLTNIIGGMLGYYCIWAFFWYLAEKTYTIINNVFFNFIHNNSKILTNQTTGSIEIIRNENPLWNTIFEDLAVAHYTNIVNHNKIFLTTVAFTVNFLTFIWFVRKQVLTSRSQNLK